MIRTALLGAALGTSLLVLPARAETTLTLAGSEWCPYNCSLESPAGLGYMVDVAKAVFEPAYKIDYLLVNWPRAIESVKSGAMTGLVGSSKRDGFVFTREPLGIAQNGFAVRSGDSFSYAGPASLAGRVLGAITGYSYTDEIDAYVAANAANQNAVQLTAGDAALTNNLRKLAAKRVDLVVEDVNVLKQQIAAMGLSAELTVVAGGPPDAVYIAFSGALPESQALADKLDAGLAELRASGRLKAILDRYHLADWK